MIGVNGKMNSKEQSRVVKFQKKYAKNFGKDKKWDILTQERFFSSVANLLNIGFSLPTALNFISETDKKLSLGIHQILNHLKEGHSFSESISIFIDEEAYQQIKIAESHGKISEVLKKIADFDRLRAKQIAKIKAVMIYPIFLICLLIALICGIKFYLIPQISSFSKESEPVSFVNNFVVFFGIAIIIFMFVIMYKYFIHQPIINKTLLLSKVPIFGKLYQKYLAYYLSGNLAILLNNGLSIKEIIFTLTSSSKENLNSVLAKALGQRLTEGVEITKAANFDRIVSPEMVKFLNSKKTVKDMAMSMEAYSQVMFQDMISLTDKLISAVQPIMFLIIGITIAATYLQLFMPIYNAMKGMY